VDKRKESQLVIKIVCVIASFMLWLYIHGIENPVTTDKIRNIPVTLENVESLAEQGLTILPNQDFTVDLTIKAPTLELNKLKAEKFKLTADVSGYALKEGEFKVKVNVKEKPAGDYTIIDVDMHVIVKLDKFMKEKVPVKTDLNITPKGGYAALTWDTKTTEVEISGPAQYVSMVKYVKAAASHKDVDKDLELNLELKAYNSDDKVISSDIIKIEPNTLNVVVPVKKTKTVDVSVKRKGTPTNKDTVVREIEVVPNKVDIAGEAALLNNITVIETEVVDLSDVTGNRTQELKLIIPEGISLVNNKGTVSVKITTDKITQKNYSIDVSFNNLGADYNISPEKAKVNVTVSGIDNRIAALNADEIKAFIDLANLAEGEHTVPITVKVPEGVTLLNTNPQNIKVSIAKKSTNVNSGNSSVPVNASPSPSPTVNP
jgi:YbbR domain-containing protein